MQFLYNVFAVLHFVGWAIVLGGYLASLRTPGLYRGAFHGALGALVGGLGMVGVAEMADLYDLDHAKIGAKTAVALAIVVLAFVAKRQGAKGDNGTGAVAPGIKHALGGLVLVNVILAVFL